MASDRHTRHILCEEKMNLIQSTWLRGSQAGLRLQKMKQNEKWQRQAGNRYEHRMKMILICDRAAARVRTRTPISRTKM